MVNVIAPLSTSMTCRLPAAAMQGFELYAPGGPFLSPNPPH